MKPAFRFLALVCLYIGFLGVTSGVLSCHGQTGGSNGGGGRATTSTVKPKQPKQPWVLHYRCEYSLPEECDIPYQAVDKAFKTKSEAIDWAERNYHYYPLYMMHGSYELACYVTYLYSDSDDVDRRMMKSVDCHRPPEGFFIVDENVDSPGGQSGPVGDMNSWNTETACAHSENCTIIVPNSVIVPEQK